MALVAWFAADWAAEDMGPGWNRIHTLLLAGAILLFLVVCIPLVYRLFYPSRPTEMSDAPGDQTTFLTQQIPGRAVVKGENHLELVKIARDVEEHGKRIGQVSKELDKVRASVPPKAAEDFPMWLHLRDCVLVAEKNKSAALEAKEHLLSRIKIHTPLSPKLYEDPEYLAALKKWGIAIGGIRNALIAGNVPMDRIDVLTEGPTDSSYLRAIQSGCIEGEADQTGMFFDQSDVFDKWSRNIAELKHKHDKLIDAIKEDGSRANKDHDAQSAKRTV